MAFDLLSTIVHLKIARAMHFRFLDFTTLWTTFYLIGKI